MLGGSGSPFGTGRAGQRSAAALHRPRAARAAGSNSVPPLPSGVVGQPAKVEANGTIDLTIGNGSLQPVLSKLTFLAASEGGFVSSTQAQTGDQGSKATGTGTVVLRVPEPTFGTVVTQVQRLGRTTSVSTTATDVTSQYVDLQARITALQASRQQYLTIMAQASSIGDILAVQSQLDTLQSQIEQLQGQLNLLNSETTYGALDRLRSARLGTPRHRPVAPPELGSGQGVERQRPWVRLGIRVASADCRADPVRPPLPGRPGRAGPVGVAGHPPPDALRGRQPARPARRIGIGGPSGRGLPVGHLFSRIGLFIG